MKHLAIAKVNGKFNDDWHLTGLHLTEEHSAKMALVYEDPAETAQLDGGTDASVNGSIEFTPPYPVTLDVTSEFALISEVINLWSRGSAAKKKPRDTASTPPARQQSMIRITAHIEEGDLYGMQFQDASGVIVPSRGRLMIHPLDFKVGEGYCNAQVLTDFVSGGPSRLRVSGHAEDVDALEGYLAGIGFLQRGYGSHQGRFPGPVGSDEAINAPLRHCQVEVIHRDMITEGLGDALELHSIHV